MNESLMVLSAHAADYVWRSGGVIAKRAMAGGKVLVVALSFGERGESSDLWKQEKKVDEIKRIRKEESENAANCLGVQIMFLDWGDYPLRIDEQRLMELVKIIREFQPGVIITHSEKDPFNADHETTAKAVHTSSILSITRGVLPEMPVCRQMRLFGFEHHQPELSEFYPDVLVDITDVYDKKKKAMECFQTQKHLINYYENRAAMRGNHARRISGNDSCQYAEAFKRYYPLVGDLS